jgi:hypothetical protein
MEKVKVTQKQFDWLEGYELTQAQIDYLIEVHPHRKRPESPIIDWSASKLARALYIGYEVEPEFKVGDWVVYDNGIERGHGYRTNQIKEIDEWSAHFDERRSMGLSSLRHATPQEIATEKTRRWWAKHDRDVWEIREDDLLMPRNSAVAFAVRTVYEDRVEMRNGGTVTFEEIKRRYKVSCFAEDRKDI